MTEGMIDDKSSPVELIAELVSSQVFSNEGLEAALRETAIAGTRLLNVDRISIWLHQPEKLTFKMLNFPPFLSDLTFSTTSILGFALIMVPLFLR